MPIYEYHCSHCDMTLHQLRFTIPEDGPLKKIMCFKCGHMADLKLCPPVFRFPAPPSKASEHIYEDTVRALGIEDIAVPKSDSQDDSDWEAPYDPSWEDDE